MPPASIITLPCVATPSGNSTVPRSNRPASPAVTEQTPDGGGDGAGSGQFWSAARTVGAAATSSVAARKKVGAENRTGMADSPVGCRDYAPRTGLVHLENAEHAFINDAPPVTPCPGRQKLAASKRSQ
jgi:hypothetical protein